MSTKGSVGMLESSRFVVKEQVKYFSSSQTYDIFDAERETLIGTAQEIISPWTKLFRWFISKQLMSSRIEVREKPDDSLVFTISRGGYLFRSRVEVYDSEDVLIGYLKSKLISWSGGFLVYDKNDNLFAEVTGNFTGFQYRLTTPDGKVELGHVTKKWQGIVKELFTSADAYLVTIHEDLDEQPLAKMLVLATALATDMIFKSDSRTVE